MAIKNIIFDYGGVLVDWNPHYLLHKYFATPQEVDAFLREVRFFEWNDRLDAGIPFEEGIAGMRSETTNPRYREVIEHIDPEWLEMLGGYYPETVQFIHELKTAGYGIYGLSNWSAVKFHEVRHMFPCWDDFDGMVVSGEVHLLKPHAPIYQRLLDTYGLKAEECVFVDDNARNIAGGEAVGIRSILHTSLAQTRAALDQLLKA